MKKGKGNIRRIKKSVPGWILIFPALFLVYFLVIRTQALCIAYSFAEMKGFRITGFAGIDNYIRVVKDSLFLKLLGNTFMYTVWSIVIGYFVPIVLAIALNEMQDFVSEDDLDAFSKECDVSYSETTFKKYIKDYSTFLSAVEDGFYNSLLV